MGKGFHSVHGAQLKTTKNIVGHCPPAGSFAFCEGCRGSHHAQIVSFVRQSSHQGAEDVGSAVSLLKWTKTYACLSAEGNQGRTHALRGT